MAIHQAKYILTHYLAAKSRQKTAGFTLPELLVGITVAGIALYAVLSLVVSLLTIEQRELAKSQTQQEMAQAMDYIAAELREAVYIYPGTCFEGGTFPDTCPADFSFVITETDVQPVLAFWKLERVLAEDVDGDNPLMRNNLAFYTLVIYSVRRNQPNTIWQENLGRLTRFSAPTDGNNNFSRNFPTDITFENDPVLVDGIDLGPNPERIACPSNDTISYTISPPATPATIENLSSFYACISNPGPRTVQEVMLFLRGNAAARAGAPGSRDSAFLPTVQTRVQARTRLSQ